MGGVRGTLFLGRVMLSVPLSRGPRARVQATGTGTAQATEMRSTICFLVRERGAGEGEKVQAIHSIFTMGGTNRRLGHALPCERQEGHGRNLLSLAAWGGGGGGARDYCLTTGPADVGPSLLIQAHGI